MAKASKGGISSYKLNAANVVILFANDNLAEHDALRAKRKSQKHLIFYLSEEMYVINKLPFFPPC
jgi:hypothetical protein